MVNASSQLYSRIQNTRGYIFAISFMCRRSSLYAYEVKAGGCNNSIKKVSVFLRQGDGVKHLNSDRHTLSPYHHKNCNCNAPPPTFWLPPFESSSSTLPAILVSVLAPLSPHNQGLGGHQLYATGPSSPPLGQHSTSLPDIVLPPSSLPCLWSPLFISPFCQPPIPIHPMAPAPGSSLALLVSLGHVTPSSINCRLPPDDSLSCLRQAACSLASEKGSL